MCDRIDLLKKIDDLKKENDQLREEIMLVERNCDDYYDKLQALIQLSGKSCYEDTYILFKYLGDANTPKKPSMNLFNAFCPNCKQALGKQFALDGMRGIIMRQHCPNCGQALDWSDE